MNPGRGLVVLWLGIAGGCPGPAAPAGSPGDQEGPSVAAPTVAPAAPTPSVEAPAPPGAALPPPEVPAASPPAAPPVAAVPRTVPPPVAAPPVAAPPSTSPPPPAAAAASASPPGGAPPDTTSTASSAPAPPTPAPRTYTLGPGTRAAVLVRYDRKATIPGHDHVLVSTRARGEVTWTAGDPAACRVRVEIPASSLVVDPPGARARAGLEGETSASDRAAILENALGKRQLDAERHPNLTFTSTGCRADGDRVEVAGVLNIHGVGKQVNPRLSVTASPTEFRASGRLRATHADFGMEPFTAVLGALRNDPNLEFDLEFVGTPK